MCSLEKRSWWIISEESEWTYLREMWSLTGLLCGDQIWFSHIRTFSISLLAPTSHPPCVWALWCVPTTSSRRSRVGFSFLWLCLPCGLLWSVEGGGSGGGNPTLRSQGYGWPLPSLFCHRGWAHLTGLLNSEAWCKHGGVGAYREHLDVLSLHQSPSNPPNNHG